jgi:hypothetical protein
MTDFSLAGGIGIMGYISPMDTEDTYAVIDPVYGIDGLRNVLDLEELNDISLERRRAGMIVGVNGGEVYYKLKNLEEWLFDITDWVEIDLTKITYVDKEIPSGEMDGINTIFSLNHTPIPGSEHIYLNGLLQDEGDDYNVTYNEIEFIQPPLNGMKIRCSYRTN